MIPKPTRRIVDREPGARLRRQGLECVGCGRPSSNAAHLLGKGGRRGDDVPENLIPLCGSGAHGCHGADHGIPSTGHDPEVVKARIGAYVAARPAMVAYVIGKLGDGPGRDYLYRRCGIVLPDPEGVYTVPEDGVYEAEFTIGSGQ